MPADPYRAASYTLVGSDGQVHPSPRPGTLGGHRRGRNYGLLNCRSALRALEKGGYAADRVFFADETTAVAAGYRPCGVCLPEEYATWTSLRNAQSDPAQQRATLRAAFAGGRSLQHRFVPLDRLRSLVIGHSRDRTACDAAQLLCEHLSSRGIDVRDVVDWPDIAASWLRHATRFAGPAPDLWLVLVADDTGWIRMRQRLGDTGWDPTRTVVIAVRS